MKKILLTLAAFTSLGLGIHNSYAQTTIVSQDFESTTGTSLPTGWSQVSSLPGAWVTGTNATLASADFQIPAHTRFVGINDDMDSSANNIADTLLMPAFSLSGVTGAYLSFDLSYLHGNYGDSFFPDDTESFKILVSTDNGTSWSTLSTDPGNTVYYWETRHLSLASYNNDASVMVAYVYSDHGGWEYGVAMDNISVTVPPAVDLALTSLTPLAGSVSTYALANSSTTLGGTVTNNAGTAVTSFDVNYIFNNGAVVTTTISGNVPAFGTYNFTDASAITFPATAGTYPVKAWISLTGDAVSSNDSASTAITTVSHMPAKRLLFEESTGAWCGWCVRGLVYMDSLWQLKESSTSIVAVHDSSEGPDGMYSENNLTRNYDHYQDSKITGFPTIIVDRSVQDDPGNALVDYANMINNFGFADLSLTGNTWGGIVTATVSVTPAIKMTGDYRLAMVITEDSVHGTGTAFSQNNYYSEGYYSYYGNPPGALTYQGVDYYNLPTSITGEHFPFVARYTVPDMLVSPNGVANSLPDTMNAGTTYNYSFNPVTMASNWVGKNLRIVIMLIDNNSSNATYGQVLNTVNTSYTLGVANVTAGIEAVRLFPNPASQQAYLAFSLQQTSNVQLAVYDMVGRLVYRRSAAYYSYRRSCSRNI
jgi:hypothetical protein